MMLRAKNYLKVMGRERRGEIKIRGTSWTYTLYQKLTQDAPVPPAGGRSLPKSSHTSLPPSQP